MGQIFAVLLCLSPLLFLAGGYYLGRYGSPIVIKRQARRDRRAAAAATEPDDFEVEVFTAKG